MPQNSGNQFQNISQIEASLWEAADQLRANSKLSSSEYCMPVLGVIFLRHAGNRYAKALTEIEADQAAGKMPNRPLVKSDFIRRRSLMLPREATYDYLLSLQDDVHLGKALVEAMTAIFGSTVRRPCGLSSWSRSISTAASTPPMTVF